MSRTLAQWVWLAHTGMTGVHIVGQDGPKPTSPPQMLGNGWLLLYINKQEYLEIFTTEMTDNMTSSRPSCWRVGVTYLSLVMGQNLSGISYDCLSVKTTDYLYFCYLSLFFRHSPEKA